MDQLVKPTATIIIGVLLFMIGYSFGSDSEGTFFIIWIICGIPYGLPRLRSWWSVSNADLGITIAIFALNFILAGLMGGFIYVWTMYKAVLEVISFCMNKNIEKEDTLD